MIEKPLRIIAIVLLLFLIVALLCSCGRKKLPDRFMKIADYRDCRVYVDTQTGVEYVGNRAGGISPLFDTYGAPLIFHGFDAREDRLEKGFGENVSPKKRSVLQHRRCLIKTDHRRGARSLQATPRDIKSRRPVTAQATFRAVH